MRKMTRRALADVISAPFDQTFSFKGDSVVLERRADRRYMRVRSREGERLYRVTKVIGGRYREDYVGREVAGTEEDAPAVGDPRDEPVLPVSYLLFDKTLRYKGYSVMVKERPHLGKKGAPWRTTCIFCHNTVPHLATIYDDLAGGKGSYQGSVSDRLLPEGKLGTFAIGDEGALERAIDRELALLGAAARADRSATEKLGDVMRETEARFGEEQLVEVGIGCEACHNGSKEHASDPSKTPSYEPKNAAFAWSPPKGAQTREASINRVCARCHTVLFSRYPYTWEGGTRRKEPGGSAINSGEARDFLLGGCASKLACSSCHDPHGEDARADLDAMGTVAQNGRCTRCHGQYEEKGARAAHTHHAPDGEGSACLSCHMPKKNAGLNYALTRYHNIGSPTDAKRAERDMPLECALCHVDKTAASLIGTMERWYRKSFDKHRLAILYGPNLDVNAIYATLVRGKAHERLTAAGALGERGKPTDAEALVPLLADDYPLVRRFAKRAIERLRGAPFDVDLDAEPAEILSSAREKLRR